MLADIGLQRQARLRVGSLSVGQRKRANVAAELLGRPEVLILDEPTSSLDPGFERTVMSNLRQLTATGHTVLAVTHSMRALSECDMVLFLATGGHVAFYGPPAEALEYFGQNDAAELFCALDQGDGPGWKERFQAHPAYARYSTSPAAPRRSEPVPTAAVAGRFRQTLTLTRRYAELILADRRHTAMLTLQGMVLGVLLWTFLGANGLLPAPKRFLAFGPPPAAQAVAVLLVLSVTWLGIANSVREIVKERHILERERRAGLSIGAYMGSKIAVLGSMTMIQAGLLTAIAIGRQRPPAHGAALSSAPLELVLTMSMAGLAAAALGLLLSAVVRTPDKALAALPVVVVAEFVLSGLQPAVKWVPGLAQLRDFAGAHWAVQAVGATVTGDAHAWWSAMFALAALTVGALAAAALFVRRSLSVPRAAGEPLSARFAALSPSLPAVRSGLLAVSCAVLVAVFAAAGLGLVSNPAPRPAAARAVTAAVSPRPVTSVKAAPVTHTAPKSTVSAQASAPAPTTIAIRAPDSGLDPSDGRAARSCADHRDSQAAGVRAAHHRDDGRPHPGRRAHHLDDSSYGYRGRSTPNTPNTDATVAYRGPGVADVVDDGPGRAVPRALTPYH